MSKYTTGEIAKLCGVTVRTIQYYDTKGLLSPTEITEGGRRLYSDADAHKLEIICYLRELSMSINTISGVLKDDCSKDVLLMLLESHEKNLKAEYDDLECKLTKVRNLKNNIADIDDFSINTIGDVAKVMKTNEKMKKVRRNMWIFAIAGIVLEILTVLLWILKEIWFPFVIAYALVAVVAVVWLIPYYYKKVSFVCPNCHEIFKPKFKEMFFANHTYKTRKLTCTNCNEKHWCVEVFDESKDK